MDKIKILHSRSRSNREALNPDAWDQILSKQALDFLLKLHQNFEQRRQLCLNKRALYKDKIHAGEDFQFLASTANIRKDNNWKVTSIPEDLANRQVEITGPPDRKMVINALNSGASTFMACFEDATAPTWDNIINGQLNLRDAIKRTIAYTDPTTGKEYQLNKDIAVLIARPRGLHLPEHHLVYNGQPLAGAFVDFGLYLFHNAHRLLNNGSGPYFYLPKLELYQESSLWNDVFEFSEKYLKLPRQTIKATVLVETLPAVFQLEEHLYSLRKYVVGMNCGRWDYIFSYLKMLGQRADYILPDRSTVTMQVPFMQEYTKLVIATCHRRGAAAIGGMAAQIPIKNNPEANAAAFDKVRVDKKHEVSIGHDGTWVAHPDLVPLVKEIFAEQNNTVNVDAGDASKPLEINSVLAKKLVKCIDGPKTLEGLTININVIIGYYTAWLSGQGAVPLNNMMEDAATAEISRSQVWQWLRHKIILNDGSKVTPALIRELVAQETEQYYQRFTDKRIRENLTIAKQLLLEQVLATNLGDFFTLSAYEKYLSDLPITPAKESVSLT